MRKYIIPALFLLSHFSTFAQTRLQVVHDSVRISSGELILRNASKDIEGYLYNEGNGVTLFKENGNSVQFTAGISPGFPADGDSVFTDIVFKNRNIKVWRNGLFRYLDSINGFTVDSLAGKIIFHPPLVAGDQVYIEALNSVKLIRGISGFSTNLLKLNSGVADNGNKTFTLRWATNNTTLSTTPKVVGLGASTLAGYGISNPPDKLGNKIAAWLTNNTTGSNWINLAQNGFTSTNIQPAPTGTPGYNIDSAINARPDFIFVSLPSNDIGVGITISQTLANYRKIDTIAMNRGIPVFWETTQPRTAYNSVQQTQLKQLADSVRSIWPNRYVEGFIGLVDNNASSDAVIKPQYAQADQIHLNSDAVQLIASNLFSRWQNYFQSITGVTRYIIETSEDNTNWSSFDTITNPDTVKKVYNKTDSLLHYYRVQAVYSNGTRSPYSNVSTLYSSNNPPTYVVSRILTDLGGDGINTRNSSNVADGKPTPSPDNSGKYWNNWYGTGLDSGFISGSTISNLITTDNLPTTISFHLLGNPVNTFFASNPTRGLNFNGFNVAVGDYPLEAAYDNMYLNNTVNPNGIILRIKGLTKTKFYSLKLWGARLDNSIFPRTLETRLRAESWSIAKSFNTRYNTFGTPNYNNAIFYNNITAVDSIDLYLRTGEGSSNAHLSLIDIGITDTIVPVPTMKLKDSSTSLPKDSIWFMQNINTNGSTITTYKWTQLRGPNTSVIVNAETLSPLIKNLIIGTYCYRLSVITSTGYELVDTVHLTVKHDPTNATVIVRDTAITLPKDSIQMTANVTNNGSAITAYQWVQLTGPNVSTIVNPNNISTLIKGLSNGIFTYKFTAFTANGYSTSDTISIRVYPDNGGKKTLRAHFSLSAAAPIPGWLNIFSPVAGVFISKQDPVTSWTIDNAGIGQNFWNPYSGLNAADTAGMTTGNNSGIVPDIALRGFWFNYSWKYLPGAINLIISGLDVSKTYTLHLVASKSSFNATPPRYAIWHINNGPEIRLNAFLNTTEKATITATPDANGKINIAVYRSDDPTTYGAYSYINALIIPGELIKILN